MRAVFFFASLRSGCRPLPRAEGWNAAADEAGSVSLRTFRAARVDSCFANATKYRACIGDGGAHVLLCELISHARRPRRHGVFVIERLRAVGHHARAMSLDARRNTRALCR